MRPSIKRSLTGILVAGVLASAPSAPMRAAAVAALATLSALPPPPADPQKAAAFREAAFKPTPVMDTVAFAGTAKKAMADMTMVAAITAGTERAPTALATG